MTTKNLSQFASEHWDTYLKSITEISKNNDGKSLVESDVQLYNFDLICQDLFQENPPSSADAIKFKKNNIELIEFKSGFKQNITKKNYDPQQAKCPRYNVECHPYYKIFWENQERKKQELIKSIRLKAIESYILLEKHILLKCDEHPDKKSSKLIFTVVIDDAGIEGIENTLAELAEEEPNGNNISSIKQALNRLLNRVDANHASYFFDEISVLTAEDFSNLLIIEKTLV